MLKHTAPRRGRHLGSDLLVPVLRAASRTCGARLVVTPSGARYPRRADVLVEGLAMADRSLTTILSSGISAWNVWRAAHADMRFDLSTANLCGFDLVGANLACTDLRKADLRGANLSDAILIGAQLEGANFFRAVLDRADLAGANLSGAQFLTSAQLRRSQNWQLSCRDADLACGAPIPPTGGRP
jgi:hypothetical protein